MDDFRDLREKVMAWIHATGGLIMGVLVFVILFFKSAVGQSNPAAQGGSYDRQTYRRRRVLFPHRQGDFARERKVATVHLVKPYWDC